MAGRACCFVEGARAPRYGPTCSGEIMDPIIPIPRKEPFDDPEWLFELKLDGFRGIADDSLVPHKRSLLHWLLHPQEDNMKTAMGIGVALLAGIVIGALAVPQLKAQG